MNQQPDSPSEAQPSSPIQETDPAIEAYLNSGYDKHIKQARNALFVISGAQVLSGIILSINASGEVLAAIWIECLIVAGIFTGLAFWTAKKPFAALLTGLVFYLLYQALLFTVMPAAILQGIIFKIFIVIYLIKGMNDAKEA